MGMIRCDQTHLLGQRKIEEPNPSALTAADLIIHEATGNRFLKWVMAINLLNFPVRGLCRHTYPIMISGTTCYCRINLITRQSSRYDIFYV